MTTSALRRHPSALVAAILALAVGVALVATNQPDAGLAQPDPEPDPEPETDPEPEPPPGPVVGDVSVLPIADVSVHGTRLFEEGQVQDAPIAIDEGAVDEFVAAIAADDGRIGSD